MALGEPIFFRDNTVTRVSKVLMQKYEDEIIHHILSIRFWKNKVENHRPKSTLGTLQHQFM